MFKFIYKSLNLSREENESAFRALALKFDLLDFSALLQLNFNCL